MNPDYKSTTVSEWLKDMFDGTIALTDFQRSHVWKPARTATFLKVVQQRPAGDPAPQCVIGKHTGIVGLEERTHHRDVGLDRPDRSGIHS